MVSIRVAGVPARNGDRVQSVTRAGSVLAALMESDGPMSVLEVSRRIQLNRSITHRLLRTLQDLEMVEEVSPGRFAVGPWNLLVGHAFLDRLPLRRLALPYVVELSNRAVRDRPWVVGLAIPVGRGAIIVDRLWQSHAPLDSILDVGTRLPFTTSANGRCLLSALPEAEARGLVGDATYLEVESRLADVRGRGHLDFSSGELRPGISAVAAAVLGADGRPAGAIAVSGLALEGHLHVDSEVAMHVGRTAQTISSLLSGSLR